MQDAENPKCKKYFDKYLSLDKNEIIPFRVSLHLLFCAKCRTAVRSMTAAEALFQNKMEESSLQIAPGANGEGARNEKPSSIGSAARLPSGQARRAPVQDPIVEAALRQIEEAGLAYPRMPIPGRVSLAKWVACGLLLILCLTAFPFTAMGKWAVAVFGMRFVISFYVIMGLAVAAYSVIFIGSNLDFFVKMICARRKSPAQSG